MLLRSFFNNPDQIFYVRELTRRLKSQINAVRRELENLETLDIIHIFDPSRNSFSNENIRTGVMAGQPILNQKKYYCINKDFVLYPELKSLILKSHLLIEKNFVARIKKLGAIDLLILTGKFVGRPASVVDLLVVGKINRGELARLAKGLEKELCEEINYSAMSRQEFKYRKDITDKFLYSILDDGEKVVIVNKDCI